MTTPFDDVTVGPTPTGTTPGAATPFAAGPSRFAPGAIVAGRYRLVALLGRGGMGEVYRTDDLTLDQPVALKFLPQGVAPTAAGERQAEAMLEAHGITKRYSGALALDKVSFRVRRGEIVGYLGPNGSGKSTTVNIVVGLLEPTSGSVTLDGRTLSEDPPGYQKKIGYVPEEPYLYAHLTATGPSPLSRASVGFRTRCWRIRSPNCYDCFSCATVAIARWQRSPRACANACY